MLGIHALHDAGGGKAWKARLHFREITATLALTQMYSLGVSGTQEPICDQQE